MQTGAGGIIFEKNKCLICGALILKLIFICYILVENMCMYYKHFCYVFFIFNYITNYGYINSMKVLSPKWRWYYFKNKNNKDEGSKLFYRDDFNDLLSPEQLQRVKESIASQDTREKELLNKELSAGEALNQLTNLNSYFGRGFSYSPLTGYLPQFKRNRASVKEASQFKERKLLPEYVDDSEEIENQNTYNNEKEKHSSTIGTRIPDKKNALSNAETSKDAQDMENVVKDLEKLDLHPNQNLDEDNGGKDEDGFLKDAYLSDREAALSDREKINQKWRFNKMIIRDFEKKLLDDQNAMGNVSICII